MSIERAREFRSQVDQDPALTARMRAHLGDLEGVRTLASELGFDCTADELDMAYREMAIEELDQVAGGRAYAFQPTFTGGVRVAAASTGFTGGVFVASGDIG